MTISEPHPTLSEPRPKVQPPIQVPDALQREIVQWDVPTWWRPMQHFGDVVAARGLEGGRALEIGARDGGTALHLAKHYGMHVLVTDIDTRNDQGRALHARHGVSDLMDYEIVDATELPYADESFDVVMFKSVLGGIGYAKGLDAIDVTLAHLRRVLRPGGVLLFAENLRATPLHGLARNARSWRGGWHFPSAEELRQRVSVVGDVTMHTTGFSAVFVPDRLPKIKRAAALFDGRALGSLPSSWHYVGYGHAVKPGASGRS